MSEKLTPKSTLQASSYAGGMSADSTADPTDPMADAAYLERCLKAPGATLIRANDHTEVKRVLSFDGPYASAIYLDVLCVKDVGVLVEHPGDALCRLGRCSSRCRNCGVLIWYEDNGVSKREMVDTMHRNLKPELVPELVARIKWEIEHGTATVINPEEMVYALLEEVRLQLEANVVTEPSA